MESSKKSKFKICDGKLSNTNFIQFDCECNMIFLVMLNITYLLISAFFWKMYHYLASSFFALHFIMELAYI